MNDGNAHDHDLGRFLRARREQLRPEDVGLPGSTQRRTPGLRREEVAVLAGVSVEYLKRIEQGRDLKPSAAIVNALANALRLTDDERAYVATLTMAGNGRELCPTVTTMVTDVAANVRAILDGLDPTPAFVTTPATEVIAGNEAWRALAEPLGLLDDDRPTIAGYVFGNPRAREVLTEWAVVANDQVSHLRAASLRWGQDPAFAELLARLEAEPEFARRWSTHRISAPNRGMLQLRHPVAGEMRLRFETLQLPDDGDQRMTSWFPADEASETALRSAIGRAPLRVVRPA